MLAVPWSTGMLPATSACVPLGLSLGSRERDLDSTEGPGTEQLQKINEVVDRLVREQG